MNRISRIILVLIAIYFCWSCKVAQPQKITLVILPDTQTYAEKYPEILDAQIDWVVQNAEHISFVIQPGDLTQNNNDEEWAIVSKAFQKLDGKVPYTLTVGNHDMGSIPGKFADVRNTTLFNQYFPLERMSSDPTFGGVFEEGKLENAYYQLKTDGMDWMIMSLEFGPRDTVLEWANKIVAENPEKLVVLNTHAYMYSDSTRQGPGDYWRAQGYGIGQDTGINAVNDGEDIWTRFVKKHPNIRFVFSGHVLNSGVGTLVSINEAGYPVYQFLANFQEGVHGSIKGGNGWLRVLTFDRGKQTLDIKTYSPYIDKYHDDKAHNFRIKYPYLKPGKRDER